MWTRRQVLGTGAALAGNLALGVARVGAKTAKGATTATDEHAAAGGHKAASDEALRAVIRDDLQKLVAARAVTVDDPWVLMHAVLALGRDAKHGNEPILDYVTRQWLEPVASGGHQWPAFPRNKEAHPNHFLEIMYATGVPADRVFPSRTGPVTRADLTGAAKALFSPAMEGDELSWTVSVFTADMHPEADAFTNADGRPFTVSAVVEAAVQSAEAGYADTIAAMRGTKKYDRSAVQGYSCNGTHVIYGILDALRNGYRGNRLPERATVLMQAALFRLGPEVELIDRVIGGGGAPTAQLNADAAKLQFLGHSIENLTFARRHGIYTPTPAEQSAAQRAEEQLAAIAHKLVATYDLDELARQVPRAYGLILGDACHALHAVEHDAA
jgi:hypothetical protein